MEKIEHILTDCIKDVKAGRTTLAECLERYPERRRDLEPLLKLAMDIHLPPIVPMHPTDKQAVRVSLLNQINASRQTGTRSSEGFFRLRLFPQSAWARVAVSVMAVIIVLAVLTGGTAYASRESLPGDPLYPVKTTTEDVRIFFAGNDDARTELNLEFAQTRLEEMSQVSSHDELKAEAALSGYRKNLEAARRLAVTGDQSGLINTVVNGIQSQMNYCDGIIDTNPKYQEPVKNASELNIEVQLVLLETLARQNALQASRLNLDNMQQRLHRAGSIAGDGRYQAMQEALLQYLEFNRLGERILQNAQSSGEYNTEFENMNLQALSDYLHLFESLSQQVPPEYQNIVQTCRQETQQFQTRARHRYQQHESSEPGSADGQPGNGPGPGAGKGSGESGPPEQGENSPAGDQTTATTTTNTGSRGPFESSQGTTDATTTVTTTTGEGTSVNGVGPGAGADSGQKGNSGDSQNPTPESDTPGGGDTTAPDGNSGSDPGSGEDQNPNPGSTPDTGKEGENGPGGTDSEGSGTDKSRP